MILVCLSISEKSGADPGGGGPGGPPKLQKEGKNVNVARLRANGPHFST